MVTSQRSDAGVGRTRPGRVLILANDIDDLGGVQRFIGVLAAGLAARAHQVRVIAIAAGAAVQEDPPEYQVTRLLAEPIPPALQATDARKSFHLPTRRALTARERSSQQAARLLQRELDDGPPGVVIATQLGCLEVLSRCDLGSRSQPDRWSVIAQYHSSFEAASRSRDLARARAIGRSADAFLLLTREDAQRFAAEGFRNAGWIGNPLGQWPDEVADPASRVVTFLGRYVPQKAPQVLLEAWQRLHDRTPSLVREWELRMYGAGRDEDLLRQVAQGLAGVSVHGSTSDPLRVLAQGSVFALPSLVEGMPLALAEAMSTGLACVAADCSSGVRELVQHGRTGLLVDRGDPAGLAEALQRLLSSGELRRDLGVAARDHVLPMRPQAVLDQWEALLAEVER